MTMRTSLLILLTILATGCAKKQVEVANTLPQGDPAAGRQAFLDLRCWSCHEIYGDDMPPPVATPKMPAYLGGNAISAPPDAELLRSIMDPSHTIAPAWDPALMKSGGGSRMGDLSGAMTAKQLFDVIAFLKTRYGK
jgi:L-cysteine S-thiosulfotransferase